MTRERSYDQVVRNFLSRAFRYDTLECQAPLITPQQAMTAKLFQVEWTALEITESTAGGAAVTSAVVAQQQQQRTFTAVQVSLFNASTKRFFGATHRIDADAILSSSHASSPHRYPMHVMWAHTESILVCFELLQQQDADDEENVAGWVCCPLTMLSALHELEFSPGSAKLAYLDKELWPPSTTTTTRLKIRFNFVELPLGVHLNAVSSIIPAGVFVSRTALTGVAGGPSGVAGLSGLSTSRPFRCFMDTFEIKQTPPPSGGNGTLSDAALQAVEFVGSLFTADTQWQLVACAHSGYRAVTGCVASSGEITLLPDTLTPTFGGVSTASPLELKEIPNSVMIHAVVAIRVRKVSEGAAAPWRPIGFAVLPLRGESDKDCRVSNVPVVRGPFSCDDSRMTMLETQIPYAVVPLTVSMTVRYFDTPTPAKRIEERIEPKLKRSEKEPVPLLGEGVPSAPAGAAAPATPGLMPKPPPTGVEGPKSPIVIPAASPPTPPPPVVAGSVGTSTAPTAVPNVVFTGMTTEQQLPPSSGVQIPQVMPQQGRPETDIATYKLLCRIMEELDKMRDQQDRLNNRLLSTSSTLALGPRRGVSTTTTTAGSGGATMAVDTQGGVTNGFELVDFAPRRSGISFATRCAMQENIQTILHPVHGTPISDGTLSDAGSLPYSILGMRLEGLTIDLQVSTVPQRLVGFMSFGALPLQPLAVLFMQPVIEEDSWRTYRIASKEGSVRGFVWCEPLFNSPPDELTLKFKSQGTVYLHFYDAVTMFYQYSTTISMSLFSRPLEAASSLIPLDLTLYTDYSLTEKVVPNGVLPLVNNVGQLHLTLFAVGTRGGVGNNAAAASVQASSQQQQQRGGVAASSPLVNRTNLPVATVIVAKKLDSLDATQVTPDLKSPLTVVTPTTTSTTTATVMTINGGSSLSQPAVGANHLHQLRANYVKELLKNTGGVIPGVPLQHQQQQQRGSNLEMEYRLRFVEKRREEAKASKIAEVLKQRLTATHKVSVAPGRSEVFTATFENPFPVTTSFIVQVYDDSVKNLRVALLSSPSTATGAAGTAAQNILLAPRETTRIPLLIHVADGDVPLTTTTTAAAAASSSSSSSACEKPSLTLRACVKSSEHGETMSILELQVSLVKPVIDRRYEVFGAPGIEVSKKLFSRLFSSASLPAALLTSAEAASKISAMCCFSTVSDPTTSAKTSAVVDPITQSFACAWEEVLVTTVIPTQGAKVVWINLYHDVAMTRHWETWELTVFPVKVVNAASIMFGRTTSIALPVTSSDRVYVSDPQMLEVVVPPTATTGADLQQQQQQQQTTTVRFKPREVGVTQCLLHALRSNQHMEKVLLVLNTSYPTPTYSYAIELSAADAQTPLLRRFLFVNRENQQRVYHIDHNYRNNVSVTPKTFALGPSDSQHLNLEVRGLALPDGQTEGRWPLWIFVNDQQDGTVESYFLNIVVRLHRPFF